MRSYVKTALLTCCLVLPVSAFAAVKPGQLPTPPASVLFYPNEVQLTVEETVTPQKFEDGNWGVSFVVPRNLDKTSFFAGVHQQPVSGFYWQEEIEKVEPKTDLPERETDPERKKLLETIATLRSEQAKLTGQKAAIAEQMYLWLWQQPGDEPIQARSSQPEPRKKEWVPVEERAKLEQAIQEKFTGLYANHEQLEAKERDLLLQLQTAEGKLAEYDVVHNLTQVYLPLDSSETRPVKITYGYIIPAGFQSHYKVNAMPKDKKMSIEQFASLRQMSGQEWKNVDVSLSTGYRERRLVPNDLSFWQIGYPAPAKPQLKAQQSSDGVGLASALADIHEAPAKDNFVARQRARVQEGGLAPNQQALAGVIEFSPGDTNWGSQEAKPAPTQEEGARFRLWKLGKHNLQHKAPNRLKLFEETLDASFYYTLRPAQSPKGYLTASLSFEKTQEMPMGNAQFFVDSMAVGNAGFAMNGDKATCYFGPDPLVTAQMRDLSFTKGSKGLISKEQTAVWDWEITVRNGHTWPVLAYVEDRQPVTNEEEIKIDVQSTPTPELVADVNENQTGYVKTGKEPQRYRWVLNIAPAKEEIIKHKVSLSAPHDKQISLGR